MYRLCFVVRLGVALALMIGCSGSGEKTDASAGDSSNCPNPSQACNCAGGVEGLQDCLSDGGWGQCLCSDASTTDGGPSDGVASDAKSDATATDATLDGTGAEGPVCLDGLLCLQDCNVEFGNCAMQCFAGGGGEGSPGAGPQAEEPPSPAMDGGSADATSSDAGTADATSSDAGASDTTSADAGTTDATGPGSDVGPNDECLAACAQIKAGCEGGCFSDPHFGEIVALHTCLTFTCCGAAPGVDGSDPCEEIEDQAAVEQCKAAAIHPGAVCAEHAEGCLSGATSCQDIYSCAMGCFQNPGGGPPALCLTSCVYNGTLEAQKQLAELSGCIDTACASQCVGEEEGSPACEQCENSTLQDALTGSGICGAEGAACAGL
jgi:hypothetical protein